MAPPEELAFPMSVTVVASARVSELIGLICWQYTSEDREPPLRLAADADRQMSHRTDSSRLTERSDS